MVEIGRIAAIWRFPTKSLRGQSLQSADVDIDGVRGDRVGALIVGGGHARANKPYRGKEEHLLHTFERTDAAIACAREHGIEVALERERGRYFDDAPISIVLDTWVDAIERGTGRTIDPLRFRPNFLIAAAPGSAVRERDLTGCELELGSVRLRVRHPIERCVVPSLDLETGEGQSDVLRYIVNTCNNEVGIYCDVLTPGQTKIGTPLTKP